MTLTQMDKDIQTYSFNEGMITLIENILSTNYKDLEELRMMLVAWKAKTISDNEVISKRNLKN